MIKIAANGRLSAERPKGSGHLLSLAETGILEAQLRDYIHLNPALFFGDFGEDILIVGTEVSLANGKLRADILAIDREGTLVIIELKRNTARHQHLQALDYAADLWRSDSTHSPNDLVIQLLRSKEIQAKLEAHLQVPIQQVNHKQRILLVAEDYSETTLRTALFLEEHLGFEIALYRIASHKYPDGLYLDCEPVSKKAEMDQSIRDILIPPESPSECGRLRSESDAWRNPTLDDYVLANRESVRTTKEGWAFFPRTNGHTVRFALDRRTNSAGRVLQSQRFAGDVEFWRERLPQVQLREKQRKKGIGRNPLEWNLPNKDALTCFLRALEQLPQENDVDVVFTAGDVCVNERR